MKPNFTSDLQRTIAALKVLKKRICAYGVGYDTNLPCDCKYAKTAEEITFKLSGEYANGCPEVSSAIAYLEALLETQE